MGKGKEIPIEVRSQVIALYSHTSKSHRQIATVIGVSDSSVTKTIRLYKEKIFFFIKACHIYIYNLSSKFNISFIH